MAVTNERERPDQEPRPEKLRDDYRPDESERLAQAREWLRIARGKTQSGERARG